MTKNWREDFDQVWEIGAVTGEEGLWRDKEKIKDFIQDLLESERSEMVKKLKKMTEPEMTKNWEEDLKLYLTSAGDRRRTIHFVRSLLTQVQAEARKEVVKETSVLIKDLLDPDDPEVTATLLILKGRVRDLAGKGKE